jgi:hypothetical protein
VGSKTIGFPLGIIHNKQYNGIEGSCFMIIVATPNFPIIQFEELPPRLQPAPEVPMIISLHGDKMIKRYSYYTILASRLGQLLLRSRDNRAVRVEEFSLCKCFRDYL